MFIELDNMIDIVDTSEEDNQTIENFSKGGKKEKKPYDTKYKEKDANAWYEAFRDREKKKEADKNRIADLEEKLRLAVAGLQKVKDVIQQTVGSENAKATRPWKIADITLNTLKSKK